MQTRGLTFEGVRARKVHTMKTIIADSLCFSAFRLGRFYASIMSTCRRMLVNVDRGLLMRGHDDEKYVASVLWGCVYFRELWALVGVDILREGGFCLLSVKFV